MLKPAISRDTVSGEALFILSNLRENSRLDARTSWPT
jgi:hypothetical protein